MVIRKISGVYHKRQRDKWYTITPFIARKLVEKGAKEIREIK
jgi:hypothetical protein